MTRYATVWSIVLAFFYSFSLTVAQVTKDVLDYNLNSPYDAIITHIGFLKEGNYYPEVAAETFSQENRSRQEAIELAIRLHKLFQDNKVEIDLSQAPKDAHYIDPEAKYHRYQLTQVFPEIYLVKVNNRWVYSEETVQNIAVLSQKETYPLGIKKLQELLPNSLKNEWWGLQLWQYMLLGLLILVVTGVYNGVVYMPAKWLYPFSRCQDSSQIRRTKRIIGLFVTLLVLMLLLPTVELPATTEQFIVRWIRGTLVLAITALYYQWTRILTPHANHKSPQKIRQRNVQLRQLALPFLQILVVLSGVLLTFKVLQFDISHMLAGISIGGIGFALASQDTIKNFFGTLAIYIDQPFSVGDTIATGNIKGKVEEIGLRATRVRTQNQSIIYVPNAKLIDTHIDNYGLKYYQHFDVHIEIAHDTTPTLIKTFMEGLINIEKKYSYTQELDISHIYIESIRDKTPKVLLRIYFDKHDQDQELQHRHKVLGDIAKLAEELSIHLVSLSPSN